MSNRNQQISESSNRTPLIDFYPAILKHTKSEGWLIEFKYLNPISGDMERGRHYMNRLINSYQRKQDGIEHAKKICYEITNKLKGGWTPVFESDNQRLYTPIEKLRELYLNDKRGNVREATMQSYSSMTHIFNEWLKLSNRVGKVTGAFRRDDAVYYMDYITAKKVSNRSYNNMLKGMRAFFSWALEHCYIKENPFTTLKTKKKEEKKRKPIDAVSRLKIRKYLEKNNPQLLTVCMLIYNAAMRPKEIANIKIEDIHLAKRYISVKSDNAKNGKARCATISREIIHRLASVANKPGNYYLFGMNDDLLPDKKRCALSKFRKIWQDMRDDLNLPEEFQLYSLRDTGMIDLLHNGVNELTVQHHYDHSSLRIQAMYTNHFDPSLNETIYKNSPKF